MARLVVNIHMRPYVADAKTQPETAGGGTVVCVLDEVLPEDAFAPAHTHTHTGASTGPRIPAGAPIERAIGISRKSRPLPGCAALLTITDDKEVSLRHARLTVVWPTDALSHTCDCVHTHTHTLPGAHAEPHTLTRVAAHAETCAVGRKRPAVYIEDLGSTNGTRVNGALIRANEVVKLSGERPEFIVGATCCQVHIPELGAHAHAHARSCSDGPGVADTEENGRDGVGGRGIRESVSAIDSNPKPAGPVAVLCLPSPTPPVGRPVSCNFRESVEALRRACEGVCLHARAAGLSAANLTTAETHDLAVLLCQVASVLHLPLSDVLPPATTAPPATIKPPAAVVPPATIERPATTEPSAIMANSSPVKSVHAGANAESEAPAATSPAHHDCISLISPAPAPLQTAAVLAAASSSAASKGKPKKRDTSVQAQTRRGKKAQAAAAPVRPAVAGTVTLPAAAGAKRRRSAPPVASAPAPSPMPTIDTSNAVKLAFNESQRHESSQPAAPVIAPDELGPGAHPPPSEMLLWELAALPNVGTSGSTAYVTPILRPGYSTGAAPCPTVPRRRTSTGSRDSPVLPQAEHGVGHPACTQGNGAPVALVEIESSDDVLIADPARAEEPNNSIDEPLNLSPALTLLLGRLTAAQRALIERTFPNLEADLRFLGGQRLGAVMSAREALLQQYLEMLRDGTLTSDHRFAFAFLFRAFDIHALDAAGLYAPAVDSIAATVAGLPDHAVDTTLEMFAVRRPHVASAASYARRRDELVQLITSVLDADVPESAAMPSLQEEAQGGATGGVVDDDAQRPAPSIRHQLVRLLRKNPGLHEAAAMLEPIDINLIASALEAPATKRVQLAKAAMNELGLSYVAAWRT